MEREYIDITVLIGNSDDKLTQLEWSEFVDAVRYIVAALTENVHFFGAPPNHEKWQNACWVFQMHHSYLPVLQTKLIDTRKQYRQDSVAIIIGTTNFI